MRALIIMLGLLAVMGLVGHIEYRHSIRVEAVDLHQPGPFDYVSWQSAKALTVRR